MLAYLPLPRPSRTGTPQVGSQDVPPQLTDFLRKSPLTTHPLPDGSPNGTCGWSDERKLRGDILKPTEGKLVREGLYEVDRLVGEGMGNGTRNKEVKKGNGIGGKRSGNHPSREGKV